jgi:hypothetical protein
MARLAVALGSCLLALLLAASAAAGQQLPSGSLHGEDPPVAHARDPRTPCPPGIDRQMEINARAQPATATSLPHGRTARIGPPLTSLHARRRSGRGSIEARRRGTRAAVQGPGPGEEGLQGGCLGSRAPTASTAAEHGGAVIALAMGGRRASPHLCLSRAALGPRARVGAAACSLLPACAVRERAGSRIRSPPPPAQSFPSTHFTFEAWVSSTDFCHAGGWCCCPPPCQQRSSSAAAAQPCSVLAAPGCLRTIPSRLLRCLQAPWSLTPRTPSRAARTSGQRTSTTL